MGKNHGGKADRNNKKLQRKEKIDMKKYII